MSNKKFNIIVITLVVAIIVIFSYVFIEIEKQKNISSNETSSYNETDSYKEFDKVVETENSVICFVNDEAITNKDIKLTEILNGEKSDTSKEKTIEQKVLLQKLKADNVILNEKEDVYIKSIVEGLKNDSKMDLRYSENEKNELIEDMAEKLYNDALIEQYKAELIEKLANKTFSTDNQEILKKYDECLKAQERWDNKEGISYSDLTEAREAVYNAYIQKLVSESNIR